MNHPARVGQEGSMARKGDGIYKRGNVWWLDAWINGKRYQRPLGKGIKRAVALELASIERAKILKGEAGIGGRYRKDMPFEKAKEEFLAAARMNLRANTIRGYEQHLEELGRTIGDKKLSEITPFLLEKHKQRRREDAHVGFNREVGTLRTLFNWCIDNGKYDGPNPTRKVKRFHESPGRDRAFEVEEEERLLAVCSEPVRTILLCGIDAGLRIPSETLWLKKDAVDLKNNVITVPAVFAKNDKAEPIPLTPRLREALRKGPAGWPHHDVDLPLFELVQPVRP